MLRRLSQKSTAVAPNINIYARFIKDSNHYSATNGRVKTRAFQPHNDHCVSVFNIDSLLENAIWALGNKYVGQPLNKRILARADITNNDVVAVGLHIDRDDKPPRHANIKGWPEEKDAWKSKAQEVAALSTLIINQ